MNRVRKSIAIVLGILVVIAAGIYFRDYIERLDPNYHSRHQRKGIEYFNKELYGLAVEELSKAAKVKPDNADTFYTLGIAYLRQNKYEEAVDNLKKALNIAPDRLDAHYSLAFAYQRMDRLEASLQEYYLIARREPGSYQVYNSVGVLYIKMENVEKALQALNFAIQLKPDYYPAYFNLAKVYKLQGKRDLMLKQYRFIKENASKRPDTMFFAQTAAQKIAELKDKKSQ